MEGDTNLLRNSVCVFKLPLKSVNICIRTLEHIMSFTLCLCLNKLEVGVEVSRLRRCRNRIYLNMMTITIYF